MRTKIPASCAAIALLISANAFAANVTITERLIKSLPLDAADSVWIDNPVGNIEVVGSDTPGLVATVMKTTTGVDQAALKEGSEQTVVEHPFDLHQNAPYFPLVSAGHWRAGGSIESRIAFWKRSPFTMKLAA